MPKITIRERDLTSAGNLQATTNAVYIPGYAYVGPINTPTLCETSEEFERVFGSVPYRFKKDQKWEFAGQGFSTTWESNALPSDSAMMYQAGDYEKSYIMAKELVRLGLPVIYERVFSKNVDNWTAKKVVDSTTSESTMGDDGETITTTDDKKGYTIKATSPGKLGEKIKFTLQEKELSIDGVNRYRYELLVSRDEYEDAGVPKVQAQITYITLDPKVSREYSDTILISSNHTIEDNSGLVYITFGEVSTADRLVFTTDLLSLSISASDGDVDEFSPKDIYDHLISSEYDISTGEFKGLKKLEDKGEYSFKFVTSGAYPTFELKDSNNGDENDKKEYPYAAATKNLMLLAGNRGDGIALIDHTPNNKRPLSGENSVFSSVQTLLQDGGVSGTTGENLNIFSAMFTPYGIYNTFMGDVMLPASFGYLSAYASQVKQYNGWLATAGVTRGAVPSLKSLCLSLTNAIADSYQPRDEIAINPITNVKPYGLTIWGARTLKNNAKQGDLTATSFLNIRQITNDVKRLVYVAAKQLTFELNGDLLWIKFKNKVTPLLDTILNSNGISAYELKRQKADKKATVKAVIRLFAVEPVEDWDITIELADSATDVLG